MRAGLLCREPIDWTSGSGIMNRTSSLKTRNCRNWLSSSRSRRQLMAERFTEQWHEIRRHVTIEKDVVKLAILLAEDKRKRQEAIAQRKI
jgi:hypothetical protein